MEYVQENQLDDFEWALGLNLFSFRLWGIRTIDQDENSKSLQNTLRLPVMVLVIFGGSVFPQFYALKMVVGHLPLVINNILATCPMETSGTKLILMWHGKTALQPVIESAVQDYLRPKSRLEWLTMRREAYRGRLITIINYSIIACSITGFAIMPFLGFKVRIINNITDVGQRALILQSYYPYNYSRSPAYELTCLIQFSGIFFAAAAVCIPDSYFCSLVLHNSAQFEILGLQIENLTNNEVEGRFDEKSLGGFIKRHVHLNRMVAAVDKSFGFVIAAQIFCMSVVVCCLGVQILSILGNTSEKLSFMQLLTLCAILCNMLLNMLVNCVVSENLASRSSEIFFKIYCCRWYMLPLEKRRCLVPMMIVAKTPRDIKAGRILPVSLATYCSIIKSTAGYISMLIAVGGR